jgi:hypothetical protein
MKLFMIRLENGDSLILQAESEEDAIEQTGLDADGADVVEQLNDGKIEKIDAAEAHLALIESGTGKQNFTIRELHKFSLACGLTDDGKFDFWLGDGDVTEELFEDYPELHAALDSLEEYWLTDKHVTEAIYESLVTGIPRQRTQHEIDTISEAVAKERTRLLAIL